MFTRISLSGGGVSAVARRVWSTAEILEAMASGTPVVATSTATEGLEVTSGQHLLTADGIGSIVDAITRLFTEPALRVSLAGEARALVEQRYSWERSTSDLEQLWIAAAQPLR